VLKRERVLVVDEISDTAEVLQAVLEPRGVIVNRVCRWGQAAMTSVEDRPAVVVCDAESLAAQALPAGGNWHGVPQIIIGTIRRNGSYAQDPTAPDVERRYLQKPFQYAELLQAIETLIGPRAAG
jgi:CheY-like chemotaxis protein